MENKENNGAQGNRMLVWVIAAVVVIALFNLGVGTLGRKVIDTVKNLPEPTAAAEPEETPLPAIVITLENTPQAAPSFTPVWPLPAGSGEKDTKDRKEQAVEAAKSMSKVYSKAAAYKYLTDSKTEYGYGFTDEEANYAIAYLEENGLADWKANAVASAKNYAESDYGGYYSKDRMFKQLASGSLYTKEEANYAIGYLEENGLVDWKEQAVKAAKDALENEDYSKIRLIHSLSDPEYEYNDGFTEEEARYAVDYLEKNGLVDWKEQAVLAAKRFQEMLDNPTKETLITVLTAEEHCQLFTVEEAEYAVAQLGY